MPARSARNTSSPTGSGHESGERITSSPIGAQVSQPRRRPRQERARATVAAILEATAELMCRLGYDRTSTNRIAERAGVSIGSLYQYFPNKEAILARLVEDHHRTVHEVVDRCLEDLRHEEIPISVGLERLFTAILQLHQRDPDLTRVLTREVPRTWSNDRVGEDVEAYIVHTEAWLRDRSDVRVADPQIAATLLVPTVESLTRWLAHDAPSTLDTEAFITEAVAMLAGYLGRS